MAVCTIIYKFIYVYERVRSLHIRERKKNTINKFRFSLQNCYLKLSVNEVSQSAMRGSHVLACIGVRLTSQLKWRKARRPARFIPYIDCAMLSQFFAYCRDIYNVLIYRKIIVINYLSVAN